MNNQSASYGLSAMNFIVGVALLVMLFPGQGKASQKPAGVRTALELIDKRAAKSFAGFQATYAAQT